MKQQEADMGNHEMSEKKLCCLLCTSQYQKNETGMKENLINCAHLYCKL
jgi:hypothetical protein